MAFLKSFKREKVNCARCHKPLGFSKNDPDDLSWGFDGKLCDGCIKYIRNGIAIYKIHYLDGHSKLTPRSEGQLAIYLFDHQYRIIITINGGFRTEIRSENLLACQSVVMNEKSTTRQILTAGFSDSKSKDYLKIEFNETKNYSSTESLILDIDYPLGTVLKNIEPILASTVSNRERKNTEWDDLNMVVNCNKCSSKNARENVICSACGEKLQVPVESAIAEHRDYVILKGQKTPEEINELENAKRAEEYAKRLKQQELENAKRAEEYAKRLKKPDTVFDVKYIGGHKGYPTKKPRHARIRIFVDRIEVISDKFELAIPYFQMTNIENMDERRITTKRWFFVGMWAIAWKKNFVYTVIEYEDEHDTLGLIFDFGKHLESKQGIIYRRMIDSRSDKSDKFGKFYQ